MSRFAGYRGLLALALRRDRVKLPAWILATVAMAAYCANAVVNVYGDDLSSVVSFLHGPAGTVMSGPGYGLERPTAGTAFAGVYGVWVLIVAAVMNVLLVGRHLRGEEEAGRLELVRACAVGRHTPLAVAATLAVAADLAVLGFSWLALALFLDPGSSALFAGGMAMVGLVFAGVALVAGQLTEHSRTATGLACLMIGVAMVIRGVGDVMDTHGSWLSWLSPLAWAQQTRVYADDRWWPLLFGLVMALATAAVGHVLQGRRDLGGGLLPPRSGRPRASTVLGTPLGLLARLERGSLIGWSIALFVAGALYGALVDSVQDSFAQVKNELLITVMGGDPSRMVDGYLGTCLMFSAYVVACYAIAAAHRLTGEESGTRTEVVLAASVSRTAWIGSGLLVALVNAAIVLLMSGLGTGLGAVAVTGSWSSLGEAVGAQLIYLPAIAVVVAVAGLGYALRPRWLAIAWLLAVHGIVVGFLGALLKGLPGWVRDLSPFGHVAMAPLESQSATPLVVLSVVAVAIAALGLARFRTRDLTT